MNELQRIEYELLKEFIRVCDILKLKYYLVCGSALGAVKYHGFIPWDDDLDVGMFREDYECFMEKAPALLRKQFHLQSYRTSKYYPILITKLRDTQTTGIQKLYNRIDMNHGIYIDIFPLDGYPKSSSKQKMLENKKKKYMRYQSVRYTLDNNKISYVGIRTFIIRKLFKYFGLFSDTSITNRKLDNYLASFSIKDSDLICNHYNWQGKKEYARKEQYGDGVQVQFEGITVRIPEKYDEYLSQKYGDWRRDLPESEKVGSHNFEIIDTEHSYTDYIEKKENGMIVLKQKISSTG